MMRQIAYVLVVIFITAMAATTYYIWAIGAPWVYLIYSAMLWVAIEVMALCLFGIGYATMKLSG